MKNIIKIIGLRILLLIGISLIITSPLMETAEAKGPKREKPRPEKGPKWEKPRPEKGPKWEKPRPERRRPKAIKKIDEIEITNVRDSTFNVSWITRKPQTCQINYGTDPENLNNVCYDDRGRETVDDTHYVTIKNLSPNTLYYFNLIPGGKKVHGRKGKVRGRKGKKGKYYTCTTGPTIGLPGSKTVYGQVFKKDGTNADGAIVYVTIEDKDGAGSSGSSAKMSCLVSSGYWTVNLGNTRTKDLSGYFKYSLSGDTLTLFAQGAGDGIDIKEIDTETSPPMPAIKLI